MIQETIVTSLSINAVCHIAPMGIHVLDNGQMLIMPFRPSTTLENILATGYGVLSHSDDVRVFAGCLTERRQWPLTDSERVPVPRLADCLSHVELKLVKVEDDDVRPKLYCGVIHTANHAPFLGFNRAQHAVLEAAILVSRLTLLPWEKVSSELDYLRIGFEKCAGPREWEAWAWLMEKIEAHRAGFGST
ncbi:MAG: DUF447 domain-containing protein [Candidatus Methylumidiphilus sp.]